MPKESKPSCVDFFNNKTLIELAKITKYPLPKPELLPSRMVRQLAHKATKNVFGGRPFDMLLLRRSDRIREYPTCSTASNVARAVNILSTEHFDVHAELYEVNCAGSLRNFRAGAAAGGLERERTECGKEGGSSRNRQRHRTLLIGTDERDPEYLDILTAGVRKSYEKVVLESELTEHISVIDNYQLFAVLNYIKKLAVWNLHFHPSAFKKYQTKNATYFDQLCPDGL